MSEIEGQEMPCGLCSGILGGLVERLVCKSFSGLNYGCVSASEGFASSISKVEKWFQTGKVRTSELG